MITNNVNCNLPKNSTTWNSEKYIINLHSLSCMRCTFRSQLNHVKNFFRLQEYIIQPCLKPGFPVSRIMIPKSSFSYDLYKKGGRKIYLYDKRQRQKWWYCVTNWFIYMTKQNGVIQVIYLFNIITQFIEMFTSSLNYNMYSNTTANWIYKLLHS